MLKSIEIKGYRCFEHYRVEGLSRVNLLVGKNNCGKTALLEAVWLAAYNGEPAILFEIARRRGELLHLRDESKQYELAFRPTGSFVKHFFYGHSINAGISFSIKDDFQTGASNTTSFEILDTKDIPQYFDGKKIGKAGSTSAKYAIKICNSNSGHEPVMLELIEMGEEFVPPHLQYDNLLPVLFITPEFTRTSSLSAKWSRMVIDGRKSEVIETMQLLDPNVSDMDFLPIDNRFSKTASDSVIVLLKSGQRVPLGTLGDGVRYLLGLAISLVQADGGMILIDEIDTGLHYSVMGDMWRLVVETAKRRDIQVFAATHSQDCIRGLARLCEDCPELRKEVSLQTIDPELKKAVSTDGDGVMIVVEQGIEVR